jgi:hypothetical protein
MGACENDGVKSFAARSVTSVTSLTGQPFQHPSPITDVTDVTDVTHVTLVAANGGDPDPDGWSFNTEEDDLPIPECLRRV